MRATTPPQHNPQSDKANHEALLTRQDFAHALSSSLRTVDDAIATGSIEIVRIGRSVRIRPSALAEFIEARVTRRNPRREAQKVSAPKGGA